MGETSEITTEIHDGHEVVAIEIESDSELTPFTITNLTLRACVEYERKSLRRMCYVYRDEIGCEIPHDLA